MIIYRSELVDPVRLEFQFVSSNDPDVIGVEVMLDGNVLIDIAMNQAGQSSVLFDPDGGQMEFDLGELRALLDKCWSDLSAWRCRLQEQGQIWEPSK